MNPKEKEVVNHEDLSRLDTMDQFFGLDADRTSEEWDAFEAAMLADNGE